MPRRSVVKESTIENRFVKEAHRLGCKTRKLNGMGNNHWPDRLVLVPGGETLLIEFKKPGGVLSEGQAAWHEDAKLMGHYPIVFDNWQDALAWVIRHIPPSFRVKK